MAIIHDSGHTAGFFGMVVDPTYLAGRMSMRPFGKNSYRLAQRSGTNSGNFSAGDIIYSFRYIGSGQCLIHSVKMGIHQVTSSGSAACNSYSLYVVRNYVASDTTNGTLLSGNGVGNKVDTSIKSHDIFSYTTTTAALSGGTGTEEPNAYSSVVFDQASTVVGQPVQQFFNFSLWSFPLVLVNEEGFRIKADATISMGTFQHVIMVEWTEIDNANFY